MKNKKKLFPRGVLFFVIISIIIGCSSCDRTPINIKKHEDGNHYESTLRYIDGYVSPNGYDECKNTDLNGGDDEEFNGGIYDIDIYTYNNGNLTRARWKLITRCELESGDGKIRECDIDGTVICPWNIGDYCYEKFRCVYISDDETVDTFIHIFFWRIVVLISNIILSWTFFYFLNFVKEMFFNGDNIWGVLPRYNKLNGEKD